MKIGRIWFFLNIKVIFCRLEIEEKCKVVKRVDDIGFLILGIE